VTLSVRAKKWQCIIHKGYAERRNLAIVLGVVMLRVVMLTVAAPTKRDDRTFNHASMNSIQYQFFRCHVF